MSNKTLSWAFVLGLVGVIGLSISAGCGQTGGLATPAKPYSTVQATVQSTDEVLSSPTPALAAVGPTATVGYPLSSDVVSDEQAVSVFRELVRACPGVCGGDIAELQFVKITVGQAVASLGPASNEFRDVVASIEDWNAPDDLAVWVVVAHGEFKNNHVAAPPTGVTYSSFWLVAPMGRPGLFAFESNNQFDLNTLGEVHGVPLPLPPYPTPIDLG